MEFQVPFSCHHPNIFYLILRRLSELHLIDLRKLQLLPSLIIERHFRSELAQVSRSAFEYRASKSSQAFASSAILFAISDLSRASPKGPELEELNIFIAFVIKMVVRIIIADLNDYAVRFREPLGKSNYIRLLSCSLIHGII